MSITAANAVVTILIPGVFNAPQQLQQFSADDVFATDPVSAAEVSMGVDGFLTAGFIFVPVPQAYVLQGDSPSQQVFDDWYAAEKAAREKLPCSGIIVLPALSRKWAMSRGFLTTYPPIPDAGKTIKPRRFGITWEAASPAPL